MASILTELRRKLVILNITIVQKRYLSIWKKKKKNRKWNGISSLKNVYVGTSEVLKMYKLLQKYVNFLNNYPMWMILTVIFEKMIIWTFTISMTDRRIRLVGKLCLSLSRKSILNPSFDILYFHKYMELYHVHEVHSFSWNKTPCSLDVLWRLLWWWEGRI